MIKVRIYYPVGWSVSDNRLLFKRFIKIIGSRPSNTLIRACSKGIFSFLNVFKNYIMITFQIPIVITMKSQFDHIIMVLRWYFWLDVQGSTLHRYNSRKHCNVRNIYKFSVYLIIWNIVLKNQCWEKKYFLQ